MNVLFICHRLPYPPNRGGKIRPFNMIRHLSHKHSVTVATLAETEKELTEGAGLKDYCDDVLVEVLSPRTRWLQAIRALPTRSPCSVAYFRSSRLDQRIREKALQKKFDIVFVHCAFVAQYAMAIPAGLRIMDFGDLDSAKWAEYSRWRSFPLSWMYAFESAKLCAYEREVARVFDLCTVITQGEKDEFENLRVSTPCTVIPNGVNFSYFSPNRTSDRPTQSIVFLGRMDYFPNIDGVCYFVDKILPLIRTKMPNVELRIVGSNPTRRIQKLTEIDGVVVTGHVSDVRPYLRDAAAAIVPLRIARGTQNKILESMAIGVPVVATPQAAKGVQAIPGRDLLVAETPQLFARCVLDLIESAGLRKSVSEAGRRQVESSYQWTAAMNLLDSLLTECSAGGSKQITNSDRPEPALSATSASIASDAPVTN